MDKLDVGDLDIAGLDTLGCKCLYSSLEGCIHHADDKSDLDKHTDLRQSKETFSPRSSKLERSLRTIATIIGKSTYRERRGRMLAYMLLVIGTLTHSLCARVL